MRIVMQRFFKFLLSGIPFLIIIGLLVVAVLVKPESVGKSIPPPVLERRDQFYGITVPEKDVIWIAGTGGKIVRSNDGGKTWAIQATNSRQHIQDISAWDSQRAVVVGNQGVVFVTGDGGRSWKEVQVPKSSVANKLIRVKTFPDGSAWTIGEMGAVLVTHDYGTTWTRQSKEEDVGWNDVTFIDSKTGFIVGEFGRILHTTDGGVHWQSLSNPVKSSLTGISFKDAKNGVAVGMEGVVLLTSNGGKTWKEQTSMTKVHLFDIAWEGNGWRAVGGKGLSVIGDKTGTTWKIARLSEKDLSWHTRVISRFSATYISGATTGVLDNGSLNIFKSTIGG